MAGCPPDGFSADGQLWGNPLYRWDYHRQSGYAWWMSRLRHCFQQYDVLRIDHFRGFDEYYAIPYGETAATNGKWMKGPGIELFWKMWEVLGEKNVIAEDLGFVTDSVKQLLKESGFPGMKVLEFAFDSRDSGNASDYLPHNYTENCVVYTGTHDNETINGWFSSIKAKERRMVREYLHDNFTADEEIHWSMIHMAMRSHASMCIIPLQDYLGYGNETRINKPSTIGQNWRWRVRKKELSKKLQKQIRNVSRIYGRLCWQWSDTLDIN